MPYSPSQKRATMKWEKENYERVTFSAPKGFNQRLNEYCKNAGIPKRVFIRQSLEEKMK